MNTCVECGKRTDVVDKHGLCVKCHDAHFIKRMKALAEDSSSDVGYLYLKGKFLNNPVCRLCKRELPKKEIDKRTGYCLSCIEKLKAKEKSPIETHDSIISKSFKVHGTSFYRKAIIDLLDHNDDYDLSKKELIEEDLINEPIYEYEIAEKHAELRPEPENEYDSNAVAVFVNYKKIGYIAKGSCTQVKNLLSKKNIQNIKAVIGGGKVKYLNEIDDDEYEFEKDEVEFWAKVEISFKGDE